MENFSEVLEIIQAVVEDDKDKALRYARLLATKVSKKESEQIIKTLYGYYKDDRRINFLRQRNNFLRERNERIKQTIKKMELMRNDF